MKQLTSHINKSTHIWSEDLDPSWFLLSPCVLKTKGHPFLVSVPALHLAPLESNHLVLNKHSQTESQTKQQN